MVWTEITRRHYRRDGLRYESNTTDAEWFVMEPLLPPASALGRPRATDMRAVIDAILYNVNRLPMATVAEGFPTLLDGAGLFLRLVARWNFRLTELHSGHGVT